MRTQLLTMTLGALLALGTTACGDDDGGSNQNQNDNHTVECGDNVAAGTETCDGVDHRTADCTTIGMGFTGGILACNNFCDGWVTTGCTSSNSCGDDTADTGETCDGSDLNGQDCTTIGGGFTGGSLACNSTCDDWDTTSCTTGSTGDSCATPTVVTGNISFTGTDITADYTDQHDLQDASCDAGYGLPQTGAVEGVFEVTLAAGQTVIITELGGVDAYLMVVPTCDNSAVCTAAADEPEELVYTATAAETVYVIAGAWGATPGTTDYNIDFFFPVCGDGIVSSNEQCDDINGTPVSNDGCSDTCEVEFGYACDNTSTSVCTAYPAFGTFNGDCEANIHRTGGALAADETATYMLTLTAPATVTGTVTSPDGDVDFYIIDQNQMGYSFAVDGNESVSVYLAAGTYMLTTSAYLAVTSYSIDLATMCPEDLGSMGNGGAVNQVEGALVVGDSYYYAITLTQDVMMSGTLTATTGDVDLYVGGVGGETVVSHADDGNELIGSALKAGAYFLRIHAFTAVPDFTLNVAFTTLAVTDIGTFAAGDTISSQVGTALAERVYAHYTITFSNDVLLSGTLNGNTTGDPGINIYDANSAPVFGLNPGDETWTDVPVSAGSYIVQVLTTSTALSGGPVDGYTLSLSTSTP